MVSEVAKMLKFALHFSVVESVGENVEEVKAGDLVLPIFQRNCGECRDCKSKKGNACSKFPVEFHGGMPRDGTSRFTDTNGQTIHHFFSVSSFVEFTVVDISHVVKISLEIPVDKACLLSCGVTTGELLISCCTYSGRKKKNDVVT